MRRKLTFLGLLAFVGLQAQEGNVGINTPNATENLDVNGTVRVRDLVDTKKQDAQGQTFTPIGTVMTDSNGVLGIKRIPQPGEAPKKGADSPAFFIKKTYVSNGEITNYDTGFSADVWSAFITVNGYQATQDNADLRFGQRIGDGINVFLNKNASNNWIIERADIPEVTGEKWTLTILFVKNNFVGGGSSYEYGIGNGLSETGLIK